MINVARIIFGLALCAFLAGAGPATLGMRNRLRDAGGPFITKDSSGASDYVANGTSLSWSHTVGATADKIIIAVGGEDSSNFSISAITFDGNDISANLMVSESNDNGSVWNKIFIYYYDSPGSGAKTVSVTFNGNGYYVGNSIALIGASSGGAEASASYDDNDSSFSLGITTLTDYAWVISAIIGNDDTGTITQTSGQTEDFEQYTGGGGAVFGIYHKEIATAGLDTGTWTVTNNLRGCAASVSIK